MADPLLNVNKILKHTAILASLSIKYTTNVSFAKCPFCKKQQLARFRLSNTSDDTTYYCYQCLYSGDLFDLYRAINYIDTVDKTFISLMEKGLLLIGRDAITDRDMAGYNNRVVKIITAIDEYWFTCKQNLYRSNITIGKQILQTYGLWHGSINENSYYRSAFRFVGFSGVAHTKEHLKHFNSSDGLKKGWQGFVVYPYELVPGVITNFVIQNEKSIKKLTTDTWIVPPHLHEQGDGFFMLSSVKPSDKVVFAFSEPAMALQVQHCHLSYGASEPAPVVAWGENTSLQNWYVLPGKKIVLYTPELDQEVFMQAILCGHRAYITSEPKVTAAKFFHEEYRNRGEPFTKKMEDSAVHWPEALVAWCMDATIENGISLVATLPIGFHEKGLIMTACKESEQTDRLNKIFGSDVVQSKFVVIGDMRIHEENNEWWGIKDNGTRERACSNPMYFEEIIVDPDGQLAPMVSGYIRHNEATIKFTAEILRFEKNPLTAYKELVLSYAKTVPYVSNYLSKKLLETIYAFQRPKSVLHPSIIGYSEDTKEFRLANIVISGTGCRSIECTLIDPPTEGLGKYPVNLPYDTSASLASQGVRSEVFMAVFGWFMRNTLCYAMNIEPKPVGIIGEPWKNPCGWRAVLDIAESFKMPVHILGNKPVVALKAILQAYNHKLPLFIDMSSCSGNDAKEILLMLKGKNVIVPLTTLQATILGINHDWAVMDARAISSSDKRTPMTWCAISFLEHYLRVGAPQYPEQDLTGSVIAELKAWLLPAAIDAQGFNKMFNKSLLISRGNRVLREDRIKAVLLDIYNIALELKLMRVDKWVDVFTITGEVKCGKDIVIIDKKADVVLISVKNFMSACSTYGGLEINPSALTEIFNDGDVLVTDKLEKEVYSIPGWVIKGSAWNTSVDALTADNAIKLFS